MFSTRIVPSNVARTSHTGGAAHTFHDIPSNGIQFLVLRTPESLVQCAQPHLTAHRYPAIGCVLDAGLDGFQRIVHFPDECFDNVFQGHSAFRLRYDLGGIIVIDWASGGNDSSQCGISTRAEDSRCRITSTPTKLKAMDSARTGGKAPVTASTRPASPLATACPSRAPIISKPYRVPVGPVPKYWRFTTRYAVISPPKPRPKRLPKR